MECLHFNHTVSNIPPSTLQQVAHVVLHTICFHRLLGTLRPACVEAFGLTFPVVADAETENLLRTKSSQMASLLASTPPPSVIELVVLFHHPSAKPSLQVKDAEEQGKATTSLRTWTSPAWLAQAFSSGAGQPSTPLAEAAQGDSEGAFERWTVKFHLATSPDRKGDLQKEMAGFREQVFSFVEANRTHIPPIGGGEVCTFPLKILVRSVEEM